MNFQKSFLLIGCVLSHPNLSWSQTADPFVLAKKIDLEIRKHLDAKKIPASPPAEETEFLRRVSLDLAGVLPTAEKVEHFLKNSKADKRPALIKELLASPEHARQMTDIWKELLIPKTAAAARRNQVSLVLWLQGSFAKNKPWDKLFHELITATGLENENGATLFYVLHESIDQVADKVGRVMLGLPLQCAQCHDHPFADWKQKEYWAFAGFFGKVGKLYKKIDGKENYGASEMAAKALTLPDSAKKVPLKYLRGAEAKLDPSQPYLPTFAAWMTAPENPFFARAQANRFWAHFFGKGLVHPLDGMNVDNPGTHPELLDLLAKEFAASGFDAQYLMTAICLSETYERSSRPIEGNKDDDALLSHMRIRMLTPFQIYDALEHAWGLGDAKVRSSALIEDPVVMRKVHGSRTGHANFFTPEEGTLPTEYKAGIPQALSLMNSKDTLYRLSKAATAVMKQSSKPEDVVDRLFLETLSRRARPEEMTRIRAYLQQHGAANDTYGDLLWALINSTEFFTNH